VKKTKKKPYKRGPNKRTLKQTALLQVRDCIAVLRGHGLTWTQTAAILDVSPATAQNWREGKVKAAVTVGALNDAVDLTRGFWIPQDAMRRFLADWGYPETAELDS
jgi:hypothetical protein